MNSFSHAALIPVFCLVFQNAVFPDEFSTTSPALTVHSEIRSAMESAPLQMLFTGSTSAEFSVWQKSFSEQLHELLGDSSPPSAWRVEEVSRETFSDHIRLELVLHADGVFSLPLYLLLPTGNGFSDRRPAVLAIHGHGEFGADAVIGRTDRAGIEKSIASANYDYGLQFVRRGYVVVAPHMIPFGPRVDRAKYGGNDPCAVTFVRMQALGILSITSNLRDLRWCLSLLEQRPEVDASRIGCVGLSYGGRMSMLVSAVDTRIRIAAVSGAMNLMQERFAGRHSCGSQMIPGLLSYGDYAEIGSLIAPRPCVWETGSSDSLIVPGWEDRFRDRLQRAYVAAGAAEHLVYDRFEGGHRWNGQVAFSMFARELTP